MKVLIAGSRSIDIIALENTAYNIALAAYSPEVWITGCCPKGPDQLPYLWNKLGIAYYRPREIIEFPADWDTYGKSAGYRRNSLMAEACDAALIIWDGESKGTKHMINLMEESGKPYILWRL